MLEMDSELAGLANSDDQGRFITAAEKRMAGHLLRDSAAKLALSGKKPRLHEAMRGDRPGRGLTRTMPFFSYRGRNARGELVRACSRTPIPARWRISLLNSGVSPIDISPASGPKGLASEGWFPRLRAESVSLEEMLLFSRQMYTLLKSGVPILKALATLQESATRIGFSSMLRDCARAWTAAATCRPPCAGTPRCSSRSTSAWCA